MNKNTRTERKDERRHHATASDHSSVESDERHHRGEKYDRRPHTKHVRGIKHAAEVADLEERRSEKHSSNSLSTKDVSDQGRRADAKHCHSRQTKDVTLDTKSRKHGEDTESRKRRKRDNSCEVDRSSSSAMNSFARRANSNDRDIKQMQAKTESSQMAVQSKTAKQTVATAYEDAVARYLARKGKLVTPVVCEEDSE